MELPSCEIRPLWFGITLALVLGLFEAVTVFRCCHFTDKSCASAWFVMVVQHEYCNSASDAVYVLEYM